MIKPYLIFLEFALSILASNPSWASPRPLPCLSDEAMKGATPTLNFKFYPANYTQVPEIQGIAVLGVTPRATFDSCDVELPRDFHYFLLQTGQVVLVRMIDDSRMDLGSLIHLGEFTEAGSDKNYTGGRVTLSAGVRLHFTSRPGTRLGFVWKELNIFVSIPAGVCRYPVFRQKLEITEGPLHYRWTVNTVSSCDDR